MAQNQNNINELRESFNYLLKINYEVQDNVKEALRLEDYLKAVKNIKNYVNQVNNFIKKALTMAQINEKKANYEDLHICLKVVKIAENIITAHLEVENNILQKYIKKKKNK